MNIPLPKLTARPHPRGCLIMTPPACTWWHHNYKHFPKRGITAKHTQHGPAKYVNQNERLIRDMETTTVHTPDVTTGTPAGGKTEYLRDVGAVVGWDEGRDASLSYAECSGGTTAGRAFHGRPMHDRNATAVALRRTED